MLDRETCEALAVAYPEVREHEPHRGDVYLVDFFDMKDWVPAICFDDKGWIGPSPLDLNLYPRVTDYDHVWAPRLDQLLDLATRIADDIEICRCGKEWIVDGSFWQERSESLEQAVAAWLVSAAQSHVS